MALTLIPHIGVVIFVLAMLKMRSWSWRAAFGKITVFRDLLCGVRGLFALVPFMLVLLLVWIELMVALNLDGSTQEVVQLLASPETGLFVKLFFGFFAVVVAPVSEELAFRGVLLPSMLRVLRPGMAVFVVSGLFATIHLNLVSYPVLFLLSIGMCIAYILSGRLSVCIIMHSLFNAFSFINLMINQPQ